MKYHPDKNPEHKEASEAKFKDVSEARGAGAQPLFPFLSICEWGGAPPARPPFSRTPAAAAAVPGCRWPPHQLLLPATQAYDVLSDKDKRAVYDAYGEEGLKAGAGAGPPPPGAAGPSFRAAGGGTPGFGGGYQFDANAAEDIFRAFFGGGGGAFVWPRMPRRPGARWPLARWPPRNFTPLNAAHT